MIYPNDEDNNRVRCLRNDLMRAGYPATWNVSRYTYESAERTILAWLERHREDPFCDGTLKMGPNGGLMFKGVELIIT